MNISIFIKAEPSHLRKTAHQKTLHTIHTKTPYTPNTIHTKHTIHTIRTIHTIHTVNTIHTGHQLANSTDNNNCFAEELQLIADEGLRSPSRNVQKKKNLLVHVRVLY